MRKNGRKSEERNYTIQSLFLVFALFAFTLALSGYFLNNDVKADTPPAALTSQTQLDETQTVAVNDSFSYNLSEISRGRILVRSEIDGLYGCVIYFGEMRNVYLSLPKGESYIPASMGDGVYLFKVVKHINGTKYEVLESIEINVRLENELMPFLFPNYMVSYDSSSAFVDIAVALCEGTNTERTARKICKWVYKNISYDSERAADLLLDGGKLSENIPNLEQVFELQKGICTDKAALATGMLRSIGVPTKLIFGEYKGKWHAWITVHIGEGEWILLDPTTNSRCKETDYVAELFY